MPGLGNDFGSHTCIAYVLCLLHVLHGALSAFPLLLFSAGHTTLFYGHSCILIIWMSRMRCQGYTELKSLTIHVQRPDHRYQVRAISALCLSGTISLTLSGHSTLYHGTMPHPTDSGILIVTVRLPP